MLNQPQAGIAAAGVLQRLRALPRLPGMASFIYFDNTFNSVAVKVAPGEYFVSAEDIVINTTLGSCVAVCLWDPDTRTGGMNHFLLPEGSGDAGSSRYGGYAMELLINALQKRGAVRHRLQAKIFGGGRVMQGSDSLHVGQRNVDFATSFLATERIAVQSKDVLDVCARRVCFIPATGKAMVKRLAMETARVPAPVAPSPAAKLGTIDLF